MNALAVVSDVDDRGPRVFARFGRGDGDRAFRAAVRHSRLVRILRVGRPRSRGASRWSAGSCFRSCSIRCDALAKLPVDVKGLVVSGTKIMMQQPRIAGFTRDNSALRADRPSRRRKTSPSPTWSSCTASMPRWKCRTKTSSKRRRKTASTTARPSSSRSAQNIVVTSSSGYRALLSEAVVDVKGGKSFPRSRCR